jgi:hypothetical protein
MTVLNKTSTSVNLQHLGLDPLSVVAWTVLLAVVRKGIVVDSPGVDMLARLHSSREI